MATKDIGAIPFQETTGGVPLPSSVDVLGSVIQGAKAASDTIAGQIVENTRDDFRKVVKDTVSAQDTLPDAPQIESTGNAQADAILSRIRTLQSKQARASSSTYDRVRLELDKSLDEFRRRFPGLAPKAEAELRSFELTDPEFQALAIADQNKGAMSTAIGKEIQDLKEYAYGSLESGKLGLNPYTYPFGSKDFALAVSNAAGLQTKRSLNTSALMTLESQDKLDARSAAEVLHRSLAGKASLVHEYLDALSGTFSALGQAFTDPTNPQNLQTLEAYRAGGKEQIRLQVQTIQASIYDVLRQMPSQLQDSPQYAAVKQEADQYISVLNGVLQGLDTDSFDPIKSFEYFKNHKDIEWESNNPEAADLVRNLNRVAPILKVLPENLNGSGDVLIQDIVDQITRSSAAFLGRATGSTRLDNLPSDASASDIETQLEDIRAQNQDIYGTGAPSPKNNKRAAMADLDLFSGPDIQDNAKVMSPDFAAALVGKAAGDLNEIVNKGSIAGEDVHSALVKATSKGVLDMAEKGDQYLQNVGSAYANVLERGINKDTLYRKERYNAWLNTPLTGQVGIPAKHVMEIDESKVISDGTVVLRVNPEYFNRAYINESSYRNYNKTELVANKPGAEARAQQLAREMSKGITEDLRIIATYNALKTGSNELDWARAWQDLGLDTLLGSLGRPLND